MSVRWERCESDDRNKVMLEKVDQYCWLEFVLVLEASFQKSVSKIKWAIQK